LGLHIKEVKGVNVEGVGVDELADRGPGRQE
jgi:hypothetical protein